MNLPDNVMLLQTPQIPPIKQVFHALKDMLTDLTMIVDKNEIKIVNFDKTHMCIVSVNLALDKHYCEYDKIIIGTNSFYLYKVLSSATNHDLISIYIEKENYCNGFVSKLGIQLDNTTNEQQTVFNLKLFEPDLDELDIPIINYTTIAIMPSVGFQKIIQTFIGQQTNRIKIEYVGGDLKFSTVGLNCDIQVIRRESPNGSDDDKNSEYITYLKKPDTSVVMRGEFPIKCLTNVIKCTPLSPNVELYLQNNSPLVVRHSIGSGLGYYKTCIAPLPPNSVL